MSCVRTAVIRGLGSDVVGRTLRRLRAAVWRGLVAAAFVACGAPSARALPSYDDVLVVINSQSPESVEVGRYFQQQRRIPERNICTISITPRLNNARMTVAERNAAVAAIQAHLDAKGLRGRINSIVLTKGIAYFSDNDMLGITGDNHLFDMYLMFALSDPGIDIFSLNPFHHYINGNWDNLREHAFTWERYGFPMVTRLDGPGTFNIRKLIDATGAPAYLSYTNGINFLCSSSNDAAVYRTNSNARGAEFISRGNIRLNEAFFQTPKGLESEPVMDESNIMFAYLNLVEESGFNDPPFTHWKLNFLPGSMLTVYRSFPTMRQIRTAGGVRRIAVASRAQTDFRRADGADYAYLHSETVAVDPVRSRVWSGSGEKQENVKTQFDLYTHQRRGGGLALLDAGTGALLAHFTQKNSGLLNDRVVKLAYDARDDRLWVASYGGIQYVDLRDNSFHAIGGLTADYAAAYDVYVPPFTPDKVYASFLYEGTTSRNSTIAGAQTRLFEIDKPSGAVTAMEMGAVTGVRPLIGQTGADTLWNVRGRSLVRFNRSTQTTVDTLVLSNIVTGVALDYPRALLAHTNSMGEKQVFVAVPTRFATGVLRTNYLVRVVETGPATVATQTIVLPAWNDTNAASGTLYFYIRHLATDPQNPDHIYMALSKQHDSTSPMYGLILRSTDGRGATWETYLASSAALANLNEITFDGRGALFCAHGYHNDGQANASDFGHFGACTWGGGLSHDNMVYNRPVVDAGQTSCHWTDPAEASRLKSGSSTAAYSAGYNSTPLGPVMFKALDGYGTAASRFAAYSQYPASGTGGHEPHMLVMEPKVAPYAPRPDEANTPFRPGATDTLAARLFSPGLPAHMDGFDGATIHRDTVAMFDDLGQYQEPASISYDTATKQVRIRRSGGVPPAGVYHLRLKGGPGGIKNLKGGALMNARPDEFRDETVLRYTVGGSAGNDAPDVDAGPDALLVWPQATAALAGTASDDGLPSGSLVAAWNQVSGPGAVSFGSPGSTHTSATFGSPGVYVLRLTVSDGDVAARDDVVVTVRPSTAIPGLVAHWDFEEAGGSAVNDATGGGFGATARGGVQRTTGRIGKGIRLDGTNALVDCGAANGFHLTERFTIAAWIRADAAPTATRGRTVASRLGVGKHGSAPGWNLGAEGFSSRLSFTVGDRAGRRAEAGEDGFFASRLQAWTHVAGVFEGGKYVALYVNGALVQKTTNDIPPLASYESMTALTLGRKSTGGDTLGGWLDEVRLYNTALTAGDISALQASGTANAAPTVNGGPGFTVTWPTNRVQLAGTVSDDGKPASPGTLSAQWSKASGPGSVVFSNPDLPGTQATFPDVGTYVLRLTATDGEKSTATNVTVTVASAPGGTSTNFARGQATRAYAFTINATVNGNHSKAVDGNRTGIDNKWWATDTSQPRYFQTALGGFRTINEVRLYCQDLSGAAGTLYDFEVRLHRGAAGYTTVYAVTNNSAPTVICHFAPVLCSNVYLSITRNASDIMLYELEASLAEEAVEPAALVPTVALTAPANGAVVGTDQIVALAATVVDPSNVASRVEFYAGALKLGQDTTSPFGIAWTNPPAGVHTLRARVVDVFGRDASSPARTLTANRPPVASVASPRNGAVFLQGETIAIASAVNDPDGTVTGVLFQADGAGVGSQTGPPFAGSWSGAGLGTHTLRLIATDDRGASATSAGVSVTVTNAQVAPVIVSDPAHATVTAGRSATFAVEASGTMLAYQWLRNGIAVGGATNPTYATPPAEIGDSGDVFAVGVSNAAGTAASAGATLTVHLPPSIWEDPADRRVNLGGTATFAVTVSGSEPLAYQWRSNAVAIAGATGSSYTTAPAKPGDDGALYSVAVTNPGGAATSADALLTVRSPTNAWGPVTGTGIWNTASNWNPATVPDGDTCVAIFTNDYTANIGVALAGDVTLRGLLVDDAGTGDTNPVTVSGASITFAGEDPFITTSNDAAGRLILEASTAVVLNDVTLTLDGRNGNNPYFRGPLAGNGTLFIRNGAVEMQGLSSNFTGNIVLSNFTATAWLDGRGSGPASYWHLGDTNGATYVYGNAFVRCLRDATGSSNAEPLHIFGMLASGSLRFYANTNCAYHGVMNLHTNGVVSICQYESAPSNANFRKDFFFNGAIRDDGAGRNMHFLLDTAGSSSATGVNSRLSQIVLGGEGSYGGFTHLSNTQDPNPSGAFDMYLQLTNGNDRLPAGTVLLLGGQTNVGGIAIGKVGASGILILAGANQELAGLLAIGTGSQSRVVGGAPTNTTLALNVAGGTTNLYGGGLGGSGTWENNLALTKRGAGTLSLTNDATYTGPTSIEAGTLCVGGRLASPSNAVLAGATLAGSGSLTGRVTVAAGGILSPGSGGIGHLSVSNLTLSSGSVYAWEGNATTGDVIRLFSGVGLPPAVTVTVSRLDASIPAQPAVLLECQSGMISNHPVGWVLSAGYAAVRSANGKRLELFAMPAVTGHPGNRAVNAGQPATFDASATGTAPLSYQWYSNGVAVAGATDISHTTPPTTAGDDGALYSVAIANAAGTATSSNAVLTVRSAPSFLAQPSDRTVHEGQTAAFASAAGGTAPLAYQWQSNGVAIVGATNDAHTTPRCLAGASGTVFRVVVTNLAGSATSTNAVLIVLPPPSIAGVGNPGGATPGPQIGLPTLISQLYDVFYTENLMDTNAWHVLTNGVVGTGGTIVIRDPDNAERRFYRIRVRQP